ncbi:DUF1189 family protein [Domibacillus tundrae]|uniref:DUF1189 family protein n=1 Tax=Domibacillus tundrae TaxID=1587527 RepID=UPI0006181FB7|nr:DUF1189 family protein [Domibacillus tundrae]
MPLYKQFIKSLYSPKHIAAFRLQGIGKTIQYLFALALVMSLPAFIAASFYMTAGNESAKKTVEEVLPLLMMDQNTFIFIPVALFFYYILLSFMLFLKASIFAGVGLVVVSRLKKRGDYRHLFRMAAYALSLSALLTTLAELAHWTFPYAYAVDWLLIAGMLFLSIRYLPGAPK